MVVPDEKPSRAAIVTVPVEPELKVILTSVQSVVPVFAVVRSHVP